MKLKSGDIIIRIYDSRKGNIPDNVDKAIQNLLDQSDFRGNIGIKYNRKPSPWFSFLCEGEYVLLSTIWLKPSNRLLSIGAAVSNIVWVDHNEKSVVYLFAFRVNKLEPSAVVFVPEAYKKLLAMFPDSTVFLTSILEENYLARQFLEKCRKTMPAYQFIKSLVTFCVLCRTGKKPAINWCRAIPEDIPALTEFMRKTGSYIPNFPVFTEESFGKNHFSGIEDFIIIKNDSDEIIACAALWDQKDYKQYIACSYSPLLSFLQPVSKWIFPLFALPSLPPKGTQLNFFTASFILVNDENIEVFRKLIEVIKYAGNGYEYFLIASPESAKYYDILKKMPGIRYRSRIYQVFPPEADKNNAQIFSPSYLELGRL